MGENRVKIQRLEGWESRLAEVVERRRNRPFSWVDNNCCSFAFRCVQSVTGVSILKDELRCVSDLKSAIRAYSNMGGIAGAIRGAIFCGEGDINFAQRGDIVVFDYGGIECCGVYMGGHTACLSEVGLEFKTIQHFKTCFFLGHG